MTICTRDGQSGPLIRPNSQHFPNYRISVFFLLGQVADNINEFKMYYLAPMQYPPSICSYHSVVSHQEQ